MEDYETNSFTQYPWVVNGNLPWFTTTDNAYDDVYCSKSGAVTGNQSSNMQITINVLNNDSIIFMKAVSSEQGYDFLKFYVDGNLRGQWSGVDNWSRQAYYVTAGVHTFKWVYSKDYVYDANQDCAWIDDVTFPPFDLNIGMDEAHTSTAMNVYPNPAADAVNIAYSLDAQSDVGVNITDAQGRVVKVLQSTTAEDAGTHQLVWSTEGFAAGIYFVNVNVDGRSTVRRIVVQ
jgi:hypothetical protein